MGDEDGLTLAPDDELLSTALKKIKSQKKLKSHLSPPPQRTDLASSPPRRDQQVKKRARSVEVSGTAPPAKRQRQQTEESRPQQRVLRNRYATTEERKTQMDMQVKEGTRVHDLVCSKDSKFKE